MTQNNHQDDKPDKPQTEESSWVSEDFVPDDYLQAPPPNNASEKTESPAPPPAPEKRRAPEKEFQRPQDLQLENLPSSRAPGLPPGVGLLMLAAVVLLIAIVAVVVKKNVLPLQPQSGIAKSSLRPEWVIGKIANKQFLKDWEEAKKLDRQTLAEFSENFVKAEVRARTAKTAKSIREAHERRDGLWEDFLNSHSVISLEVDANEFFGEPSEDVASRKDYPVFEGEQDLRDGGVLRSGFWLHSKIDPTKLEHRLHLRRGSGAVFQKGQRIRLVLSPYHIEHQYSEREVSPVALDKPSRQGIGGVNDWIMLRKLRLRVHADLLGAASVTSNGELVYATVKSYRPTK